MGAYLNERFEVSRNRREPKDKVCQGLFTYSKLNSIFILKRKKSYMSIHVIYEMNGKLNKLYINRRKSKHFI